MTLKNVYGKLVHKNVSRALIKWDGKSKSQLQFRVKQFLKPYWRGLVVYEEFPVYGTLLKVDILNATLRIAIEVQGPQHNQFHYFHNNSPNSYLTSIKCDYKKSEWLGINDFQFIEINHDEVDLLSREFFKNKFGLSL